MTEKTDEKSTSNKNQYRIFTVPINIKSDIYLTDSVEHGSDKYIDLLRHLDEAKEDDQITIHLANLGGSCHSGLRLAHSIMSCKAHVDVIVEAPCYSMGAILSLTGDTLEMKYGTFLMFHNYSGGRYGKGGETIDGLLNTNEHLHKSFEYICRPFLTKAEMERIKSDKDVYIHQDDKSLSDRIRRHFKI